ncbi:MAG: hypothetical protein H8E17_20090, partial [Deltaproteobacteria bacterium]|nr:hypothetical protein [Deltaproteobacteria bacterium]
MIPGNGGVRMKLHDCPKDKSLYLIMIAIIPLILLALLLTPAAIVWSDDGDDCAGCEGECTQLKEQCIEGCNEIKSKAGALGLNYEERSAFGCHARACSWTFSRSWCLVPGYLECATLAYKNHIKCNTNCVYEYKAAKDAGNTEEMKTIMENCRPKCNEELQDDIFYKDLNCRLQACKVWCKQKGYPDAGYIRSEDKCKCLGERVDEPPKTDSEPQVTATQAEEEYSIFPPRVEVEVGKTVIFSVLTEDGDNIPEDKRSDFVWGTENHNPLNSIAFGGLDVDLNEIKIGKIFPTREFEYVPHVWGEFEATNLGQCQVCLYSGDKIIAKANVEVKRPEDIETAPQENIQNIQQLFLDEGFMGPIRNTSLSGWEETMTSLGAGEHFVSLLGLYLLGGPGFSFFLQLI